MLLAADGVNYQQSISALNTDGLFSKYPGLFFQPAGYPLLIWTISLFGLIPANLVVVLLQSSIHVLSVLFLYSRLQSTQFFKIAPFLFLILMFNPILCMSAMNCGYESLVSSFTIVIAALLIASKKIEVRQIILVFSILTVMILMNSRFLGVALITLIYFFSRTEITALRRSILLSGSACILLPTLLLTFRNEIAVSVKSPATNVGVTLNWGAGDNASGAHNIHGEFGVPCKTLTGSDSLLMGKSEIVATFFNLNALNTPADVSDYDTKLRNCVIQWYRDNPSDFIRLFVSKSIFFFSPFTGPLSSGTFEINNGFISKTNMELEKLTKEGNQVNLTKFGYAAAYIALLFLCLIGVINLYRVDAGVTKFVLGILTIQWLISAISIGDNRFRIPAIPLVWIFATYGLVILLEKKKVL